MRNKKIKTLLDIFDKAGKRKLANGTITIEDFVVKRDIECSQTPFSKP